jgi:serine/threonine protein phosphatase 1
MREFGVETPEDIPQRYLDFLSALPLVLVLDDYVLVHAGLDFSKASPLSESSPEYLLWARDYKIDPAKLGGRTLVTGHTRTPLFEIKTSLATSHIKLDNGCCSKGEIGYGSLVALNLDTKQLLVQVNMEKEAL